MALNNIRREPRREITEQLFGFVFVIAYAAWIAYSIHLSTTLIDTTYCADYDKAARKCLQIAQSYWRTPGPFFLTIILSLSVWLAYPFLLLMHAAGEMVCGWLAAIGIDPRPRQRY